MPLEPGTRLGQYEILGQIGAGGMGEVYRARDTRLEREVAIKILSAALARDPDALARFEREALSVAKLSHPNVLAIYEFGRHQDTTFVVTELVEGVTLRDRLATGPLPQRRAVAYAQQIARGIAAAHARGIVHRDLKPENVMIGRDDQVKILDFGLAKPAPAQPADETRGVGVQTHAGIVLGTFAYMAPEQIRGVAVDHRADIFAFGATLYEMLSGERAFKGETAADTMTAILTKEPPDLDAARLAIPPALDRIVRRCLEKSPELRFQSATDLAFALETLSSTATPAMSAVGAAPAAIRTKPWTRVLAGVAVLAVVAAAGVAAGRLIPGTKRRALPAFTRLTFRRGSISGARFAPDGQTIVYSAVWDSEPQRIYPLRLERPRAEAQPLVEGTLLAVSPSGDMAVITKGQQLRFFVERGTLAQVPLTGGEPRPLLEQVDGAAAAPDGRLAVVRSVGGRTRLEFPTGTVLYETAGWISSPRFSPDGGRLAFHEHPLVDDDRGWVSVVEVSTHALRRLTGEVDTLSGLAWAPGASEVCFASGATIQCAADGHAAVRVLTSGPLRMILRDIAADGRILVEGYSLHGKQVVSDAQGREVDLSWQDISMPISLTHDGRRLLFATVDYNVMLRGIDRGLSLRLGSGMPVDLSPDDRWVLAIAPDVPTQLTLVPTGAGETRGLPRGRVASHNWAEWLPDGHRVVMAANEAGRGSRLYVQSVDGGEPAAISGEGVRLAPYVMHAISSDGRVVVAEGPDGSAALYPLAGGEPHPIAGLGDDLVPVGWTDTPNVLFARTRQLARLLDIYRVDVVSGRRERWRTIGESDPSGAPRVVVVLVTPDGRQYAYHTNQMMSDLYLVSGLFD